jgi:hypothetical protein
MRRNTEYLPAHAVEVLLFKDCRAERLVHANFRATVQFRCDLAECSDIV